MEHLISEISLTIQTDKSILWQALTDPEQAVKYMFNCVVSTDWIKGNDITWQGNYQGYDAFQKGKILEIIPGELLKYSTLDPNHYKDDPQNYIHISFEIEEATAGLNLIIRNETFDGDQQRLNHITGSWQSIKETLKATAESLGKNG